MIHHFTNLICWREIFSIYVERRDKIYCDTISMQILGRLFKNKIKKTSGATTFLDILKKDATLEGFILLSDKRYPEISSERQFPLPYFEFVDIQSIVSIIFDKFPELSASQCEKKIIIGVSSPKQNLLAAEIFSKAPHIDIYCLGAALKLFERKFKNEEWQYAAVKKVGFVYFLRADTKRTVKKMLHTAYEFFRILILPSSRLLFRSFCVKISC